MTTDTIAHRFASMIIFTNDDAELRNAGLDVFSTLLTHSLSLDELKVKLFRFSDDSIVIEGPEPFALSTVESNHELSSWLMHTFPNRMGQIVASLESAIEQAIQ